MEIGLSNFLDLTGPFAKPSAEVATTNATTEQLKELLKMIKECNLFPNICFDLPTGRHETDHCAFSRTSTVSQGWTTSLSSVNWGMTQPSANCMTNTTLLGETARTWPNAITPDEFQTVGNSMNFIPESMDYPASESTIDYLHEEDTLLADQIFDDEHSASSEEGSPWSFSSEEVFQSTLDSTFHDDMLKLPLPIVEQTVNSLTATTDFSKSSTSAERTYENDHMYSTPLSSKEILEELQSIVVEEKDLPLTTKKSRSASDSEVAKTRKTTKTIKRRRTRSSLSGAAAKPVKQKRKSNVAPEDRLYGFLWRLLQERSNHKIIQWVDKPRGIFKLIDTKEVSRLWGVCKRHNGTMTYDGLGRALRYYYHEGIIHSYPKRLHFQFNLSYVSQLQQRQNSSSGSDEDLSE